MVDKNSLYQRGMAGIVPVNPLAPETVERQIDQILEEIFMEEKSREFAKRGYVLDFNTAQILSSDEKRLFIQYHDLKKRMAVDMDSQSAIMKDAQRPTTKILRSDRGRECEDRACLVYRIFKEPEKVFHGRTQTSQRGASVWTTGYRKDDACQGYGRGVRCCIS